MLLPQLPLFRLGLGARLGTGLQWMSWISLTDHIRALRFLADHRELTGPVNLVAPRAVTNTEFTEELAHALGRRAPFTLPRAALLAIAGKETTDEFLLASQRVVPRVLEGAGFSFDFPELGRSAFASSPRAMASCEKSSTLAGSGRSHAQLVQGRFAPLWRTKSFTA